MSIEQIGKLTDSQILGIYGYKDKPASSAVEAKDMSKQEQFESARALGEILGLSPEEAHKAAMEMVYGPEGQPERELQ